MLLRMLKAKIHGARVTEANISYVGSITIDRELMDAAGLRTNEMVMVADVNNGHRLTTYVIPAPAGSGVVCINGAAARLVSVGDTVIVFAFAYLTPEEADKHQAIVVIVDDDNRVKDTLRH